MGIWWRKTAQLNESLQPSYWLPVRQDFQLTSGTLPFSRAKLLIFSSLSRKIMSFTLPLKWMLVKTQDEWAERNTSARLLRNPSHDTMRAESLPVFFLSKEEKSRSWAWSIQPKFQPVRPRKVVHLKRWTRYFETFPVGPNRSIEFWTEIFGNFGWMDRAPCFLSSNWLFRVRLFIEQTDGHNRARCTKRTTIRPGFETIS